MKNLEIAKKYYLPGVCIKTIFSNELFEVEKWMSFVEQESGTITLHNCVVYSKRYDIWAKIIQTFDVKDDIIQNELNDQRKEM